MGACAMAPLAAGRRVPPLYRLIDPLAEPPVETFPMLSLLPQAPAAQDAAAGTQTIGEFITTGGVMMWPILGCSVIVVGLAIERSLALQKARIVPAAMHDAIEQVCQGRASAVAAEIAESDAPAG